MRSWLFENKISFGPDKNNKIIIDYINNNFIIIGDSSKIIQFALTQNRRYFYVFEIKEINNVKQIVCNKKIKSKEYLDFINEFSKYIENEVFL